MGTLTPYEPILPLFCVKTHAVTVETIDQNLEIIVNVDGNLLEYHYEYPIDILGLLSGDKKCHLYNPDSF